MIDFDLRPEDCRLLVVDVQERFLGAIPEIADDGPCGIACRQLIAGMGLLGVPVLFTEQSPDKLGSTLPALRQAAAEAPCIAKTAFSCADDPIVREALISDGREWVVVCGIEAHVCVLGTVDDLLRRGWNVVVAADAVASRRPENRELALAAMRQLGALTLPVESILFRLQRDAAVGRFRELSKLVK